MMNWFKPMNKSTAFAKLRPMMPMQALADALGKDWRADLILPNGYLAHTTVEGAGLRIDDQGRIGRVFFYQGFSEKLVIDGLCLGMSVKSARAAHPALMPDAESATDKENRLEYRCTSVAGYDLVLRFKNDQLLGFDLELPNAAYPNQQPKSYPTPPGIRAYDLEMLPYNVDRSAASNHGWVFGLPPGITADQWPLDPVSGYPLMHGFTLRLPEDYRVHGPDIVALSFFATASDQGDGGADVRVDLYAAVTAAMALPPENQHLLPFAKQAASSHPRLHRMQDILDYEYAVILLTEAEFNDPLCQPPEFGANPYLDVEERPKWMVCGGGYAMFIRNGGSGLGDRPVEELYSYKQLGAVPDQRLDWNRAIGCEPRAQDLNAGLAPEERFDDGPGLSGYIRFWYWQGGEVNSENYREHEWAKNHKPNHIGGPMRPIQAHPEFSPFYIGFEEGFGGYNFGGGNAQLDFFDMKFDWACG